MFDALKGLEGAVKELEAALKAELKATYGEVRVRRVVSTLVLQPDGEMRLSVGRVSVGVSSSVVSLEHVRNLSKACNNDIRS